MNWALQQLCEVGNSLPPPYPRQTEVNRVRPSVPSHTGTLQPNWSCCVSASITMTEAHLFLAKLLSSWYKVLQARKLSVHTDTLSWTNFSHLRRDRLSSGQAAVSINYRWSINRPSSSYMPSGLLWWEEAEARLCWSFCFWSKVLYFTNYFFFSNFF